MTNGLITIIKGHLWIKDKISIKDICVGPKSVHSTVIPLFIPTVIGQQFVGGNIWSDCSKFYKNNWNCMYTIGIDTYKNYATAGNNIFIFKIYI